MIPLSDTIFNGCVEGLLAHEVMRFEYRHCVVMLGSFCDLTGKIVLDCVQALHLRRGDVVENGMCSSLCSLERLIVAGPCVTYHRGF